MKKVRIILAAFACTFALTAAVAFDYTPTEIKWYSRHPDTGVPMQQLDEQPTCFEVFPVIHCAAQYEVTPQGVIVSGPSNAQFGEIQD